MGLASETTKRVNGKNSGKISDEAVRLFTAVCHFILDEALSRLEWPDLAAVVELERATTQGSDSIYGAILPILTCVATNGQAGTAVPLAAAWLLYDLASDLFDDMQDRDGKNQLWNDWEPARAMNVGLGLIAAGNICLTRVHASPDAHRDILDFWAHTFARAAQGQINSSEQPSLETYFRQTIAKSGLIYATVARAGARLNTDEAPVLDAMYDYGYALGMVIQLVDDCRDLLPSRAASDLTEGVHTLPVIQALSQKESKEYPELSTLLVSSRSCLSADELEKALHLISKTGALSHSFAFARFYEQKALGALKIFPPEQITHLTTYVSHFLSTIHPHG